MQCSISIDLDGISCYYRIHGLGEHEDHWNVRRYQMGGSYGSRLEAGAGWTPVYLRVNTGLSVAENGIALTALYERMAAGELPALSRQPVDDATAARVLNEMDSVIRIGKP